MCMGGVGCKFVFCQIHLLSKLFFTLRAKGTSWVYTGIIMY